MRQKFTCAKILLPLMALLASSGCTTRKLGSSLRNSEPAAMPQAKDTIDPDWQAQQQVKNKALQEYLEKKFINSEIAGRLGLDQLKDSPLNWFQDFPLGFYGPPLALLKSFSAIKDPEVRKLFGAPTEFFKPTGFGRMPPKDFAGERKRSLPLGLAYTHTDPQLNFDLQKAATNPAALLEGFKPPVAVAVVSCGACHIGRVQFRDRETEQFQINSNNFFGYDAATRSLYLVGAPNTEFDANHFRHTLERFRSYMLTIKETHHQQYLENIKDMSAYILQASEEEIYGKSTGAIDFLNRIANAGFRSIEKAFIAKNIEKVLDKTFEKLASRIAFNENMIITAQGPGAGYQGPVHATPDRSEASPLTLNGATPGQLDAFNLANSVLLATELRDPSKQSDFLHGQPAMSDLMSTWTQKIRPYGNWNGNMKDHFYRNLGASFGGVADARMVDPTNVYIATQFLLDLPSPSYPFPVDTEKAARGQKVFEAKCASCHGNYDSSDTSSQNNFGWEISRAQGANSKDPFWLDVGTDMGRAWAQTQAGINIMVAGLKTGCLARTEPDTHHIGMEIILTQLKSSCEKPTDAEIGVPAQKVRKGYIPLNLTGIWARAPYLHNGSVPTLFQLLSPPESRAKTFWRGVPFYDRNEVGFVWNKRQLNELANETIAGRNINWFADYPTAALYDTAQPGRSNAGHYNLRLNEETGEAEFDGNWPAPGSEDQLALLEFLKTL